MRCCGVHLRKRLIITPKENSLIQEELEIWPLRGRFEARVMQELALGWQPYRAPPTPSAEARRRGHELRSAALSAAAQLCRAGGTRKSAEVNALRLGA